MGLTSEVENLRIPNNDVQRSETTSNILGSRFICSVAPCIVDSLTRPVTHSCVHTPCMLQCCPYSCAFSRSPRKAACLSLFSLGSPVALILPLTHALTATHARIDCHSRTATHACIHCHTQPHSTHATATCASMHRLPHTHALTTSTTMHACMH